MLLIACRCVLMSGGDHRYFLKYDAHTHSEVLTRVSKVFCVTELARISGRRDLRVLQNVYYAPSVKDLSDKLD